jgi:hypothetical protein
VICAPIAFFLLVHVSMVNMGAGHIILVVQVPNPSSRASFLGIRSILGQIWTLGSYYILRT